MARTATASTAVRKSGRVAAKPTTTSTKTARTSRSAKTAPKSAKTTKSSVSKTASKGSASTTVKAAPKTKSQVSAPKSKAKAPAKTKSVAQKTTTSKATTAAKPKSQSTKAKKPTGAHGNAPSGTYAEMVVYAVGELKDRKGATHAAILKFIAGSYIKDPKSKIVRNNVKKALESGVEGGALVHVSGKGTAARYKPATKTNKKVQKTNVPRKTAAVKKAASGAVVHAPAQTAVAASG